MSSKLTATRRSRSTSPPTLTSPPTSSSSSSKAVKAQQQHKEDNKNNNNNNKKEETSPFPFTISGTANKSITSFNFHHFPSTINPKQVALASGYYFHQNLMLSHTGCTFNPTLSQLPLPKPSSKIAAFDFDGCLAKTSLFLRGMDQWSILYEKSCPLVLKELREQGYLFVLISNQADIGKATEAKHRMILEKSARFNGFVAKMQEPCVILCCAASTKNTDDEFRKPKTGSMDFLEKYLNAEIKIDKKKSFYCGDAAGRPKGGNRKKADHSDSDKVFARNCHLPFFTEDQVFEQFKYRELF